MNCLKVKLYVEKLPSPQFGGNCPQWALRPRTSELRHDAGDDFRDMQRLTACVPPRASHKTGGVVVERGFHSNFAHSIRFAVQN